MASLAAHGLLVVPCIRRPRLRTHANQNESRLMETACPRCLHPPPPTRPSRSAETGNTALHDLPRGFASLYPAIRDAGADTTAVNYAGFTPMHCAAARADAPLARLLLRDGADAANGARAGESPTRGQALPSATGVGGPGTAVPAMSARSVAMVQSLAASGAAAPAEDRRGVPPVGSPDVMVRAPLPRPPPPPPTAPPAPLPAGDSHACRLAY